MQKSFTLIVIDAYDADDELVGEYYTFDRYEASAVKAKYEADGYNVKKKSYGFSRATLEQLVYDEIMSTYPYPFM